MVMAIISHYYSNLKSSRDTHTKTNQVQTFLVSGVFKVPRVLFYWLFEVLYIKSKILPKLNQQGNTESENTVDIRTIMY